LKHIVKHIHFVGIGGAGMSGIAEVLLNLGYRISGSDTLMNGITHSLAKRGAIITHGHAAENIHGADVVVTSTAITQHNPEVLAAYQAHIPVIPRALMLAELMRLKQGIAVAGTHGKTTTTSLISAIFAEAGWDPTFVIGGRLNSARANARLGNGDFIVVETDESDASFLHLFPVMEVVTNIDTDHMETYAHNLGQLKQAFIDFIQRLPFYGIAAVCIDDVHIRSILPELNRPVISYGFSADAQVRAVDLRVDGGRMHFTVLRQGSAVGLPMILNLPGRHNVLNALAALTIATKIGISDQVICAACEKFAGVERRFQNHGELSLPGGGGATLIDDYGHHPTELVATIDAARAMFPGRRIVLAFQPHRYSRTRDCFAAFTAVLSTVDALVLTEVYAASEAPILTANGWALACAVRDAGRITPQFIASLEALAEAVYEVLLPDDILLVMGAGSINILPAQLVALAQEKCAPGIQHQADLLSMRA
jgi:UDP-N-acetylmuramate--alanine ligase